MVRGMSAIRRKRMPNWWNSSTSMGLAAAQRFKVKFVVVGSGPVMTIGGPQRSTPPK